MSSLKVCYDSSTKWTETATPSISKPVGIWSARQHGERGRHSSERKQQGIRQESEGAGPRAGAQEKIAVVCPGGVRTTPGKLVVQIIVKY